MGVAGPSSGGPRSSGETGRAGVEYFTDAMANVLAKGFSRQDVASHDPRTRWLSPGPPFVRNFLFRQNLKIIPLNALFKSYLRLRGLQNLSTGRNYMAFQPVKSIYSL